MSATLTVRPATAADLDQVKSLLVSNRLPIDGLEEQFGAPYVVADAAGTIVAAEGVERYDDAGLLRSAVVAQEWRGQRLGERLTRERLVWARDQGMREVWLLTTTAADYFPRFGFTRVARDTAPEAIQRSREFREACPASAVAMRLQL
jgi:N-acetylglutamate synthase-like GNAT family acetyltransferase